MESRGLPNSREDAVVVVVGLGEVGRPLSEILAEQYCVLNVDLEPVEWSGTVSAMHICYPYVDDGFIETTCKYIEKYRPFLTIIHSTVIPGVTNSVYEITRTMVAYSPVRGKHTRMKQQMREYVKFISGATEEAGLYGAEHLRRCGFRVESVESCTALELSKLIETTYLGVLVSWAQEVERFCRILGVEYMDAVRLCGDVPFFPPVVFQPGFIGGHCVMQNLELLERIRRSVFIDTIKCSNEKKREEMLREGRRLEERLMPLPYAGSR
jgi:UDP-N-acetyl-D-mannosaminuronate dehydrogenase